MIHISKKQYIKSIKDIRATNEKNSPMKTKVDVPKVGVTKAAEMLFAQDMFVYREILTQSLLRLYVCNTGIFSLMIDDSIKNAIEYDEQYIDECVSEMASLMMEKNIYINYNSITFNLSLLKNKKVKSELIEIESIIDLCDKMVDGGF